MKTIAIISQKGGAGKTTLAVHLAVAAEEAQKTAAIIDLDPQASAAVWKDLRKADNPAVVTAQISRLSKVLEAARDNGVDLAILDTAPHSESSALAAARASDLILIPCRPAILDLKAINLTVDLAKLAGKPAFVVFNAVPPRGSLADEATAAVQQLSVAAEKGAIMAGRKGPAVWLRDGLWKRVQEPKSKAVRLGHSAWLPYGNFGCPAATARPAGTVVKAVVRSAITRS